MIEPETILVSMYESGVKLTISDGNIRCHGALAPEQIGELRNCKQRILDSVTSMFPGTRTESTSMQTVGVGLLTLAPLSFQQEPHWKCVSEGNPYYGFETFAIRLTGRLSIEHLIAALRLIVQRHSILKSRIISVCGVPWQADDGFVWNGLNVVEISGGSVEFESRVTEKVRALSKRHVDWVRGPLFDAALFKHTERDHVLGVFVDNAIIDGLSMAIFFRELWLAYTALQRGEQPLFGWEPKQYVEYACWQHRAYVDERQRKESYWAANLERAMALRFPVDCGGNRVAPFSAGQNVIILGNELTADIHALGRHQEAPASVVVLAMYFALLSKWCNQRDITVDVVIAGRTMAEYIATIGFFAQVVPLRVTLGRRETFAGLIGRVRQQLESANANLDIRQAGIIPEELKSGTRFNWLSEDFWTAYEDLDFGRVGIDAPELSPEPSGLDGRPLAIRPFLGEGLQTQMSSVDVSILMRFAYSGKMIVGFIYYRADMFREETISQFGMDFRELAELMVQTPGVQLSNLRTSSGRQVFTADVM